MQVTINANTSDQTIFKSERSAIAKADFSYSISSPNETYTLKLGFAEIGFNNAGERFFNVFAQGEQILFGYDIIADSGGNNIAIIKSFSITVINQLVNLSFVSLQDNAKISNIEIVPITLAITNPATPLMLLACL